MIEKNVRAIDHHIEQIYVDLVRKRIALPDETTTKTIIREAYLKGVVAGANGARTWDILRRA